MLSPTVSSTSARAWKEFEKKCRRLLGELNNLQHREALDYPNFRKIWPPLSDRPGRAGRSTRALGCEMRASARPASFRRATAFAFAIEIAVGIALAIEIRLAKAFALALALEFAHAFSFPFFFRLTLSRKMPFATARIAPGTADG